MKVSFYTYIQNQGDGSAAVLFFRTREDAEAYALHDDERLCDDIEEASLEFDALGNLLTKEDPVWDEGTEGEEEGD